MSVPNFEENVKNLEEIQKLAECPICLEPKTDNRVLVPCGHTICTECLEKLLVEKITKCSLCKEEFQVPSDGKATSFVKDYGKNTLANLMKSLNISIIVKKPQITSKTQMCVECETKDAIVWCEDCKAYFCEGDNLAVHKPKALRFHQPVGVELRKLPIDPSQENAKHEKLLCEKHPSKKAKYFCPDCNSSLCSGTF
jgi:tripartite motif-containing protein 56